MNLKRTIGAAIAALLIAAVPAAAAESYSLDPTHSEIGFAVRHFGISKVRGEFKEYSAELMVDLADLANSSIVLDIKTASVDTDNERRDGHLRSNDFFNAETFPSILFRSKSIRKAGDAYEAVGDLTIRDKTQEVVVPVEVAGPVKDPWGNLRLGIEGEVTIDRMDYGVSWSSTMDTGGLVVSNEVKVSFSIEATRPLPKEAEGR